MSAKDLRKKKFLLNKSEYLQDLRRERLDEPEELHLGGKKKSKFVEEMDKIEKEELD